MQRSVIASMQQTVVNLLETMAKLEVLPQQHDAASLHDHIEGTCLVCGAIKLTGPRETILARMLFPEPVILPIANNMLPGQRNKVDEVVVDLVRELANMVVGLAKNQLDNSGDQLTLSLPKVSIDQALPCLSPTLTHPVY